MVKKEWGRGGVGVRGWVVEKDYYFEDGVEKGVKEVGRNVRVKVDDGGMWGEVEESGVEWENMMKEKE